MVDVGDWGSSPGGKGRKVRVVWSSGASNVYRWRLREQGKVVSDVKLAEAGEGGGPEGLGGSQAGAEERVKLTYPVEAVRSALMPGGEGRSSLTKRTIIRYLKEVAPRIWIAEAGLEASENGLVRDLTGEAVVRLYESFAKRFAEPMAGDRGGGGGAGGTGGGPEGSLTPEDAAYEEREAVKALLNLLLSPPTPPPEAGAPASASPQPDPDTLSFLALLHFIILGLLRASRDPHNLTTTDFPKVLDLYRANLRAPQSREFKGESGAARKWDWPEGIYRKVGGEEAGDGAAEGGAGGRRGRKRTTQLDHIRIDSLRCHPTMAVMEGGVTLVQGGDKGWGVALSRRGFARGTGTHRWTVRLDRVNRRGHVFLGVARRSVGLASFLGNDASGWGYLQSQDLYHAGSRRRSQYGEKINQGSTVEIILDSDEGTVSIGDADRGMSFGVAFTDLYVGAPLSGPDSLIYPAFSLHHAGDMITLLSFDGTPAEGDDSGGPSPDLSSGLGLQNVFLLGPPPAVVVSYVRSLLDSAARLLAPLAALEGAEAGPATHTALDHPVLSLLLPTALLALYRFQVLTPLDEAGHELCKVGRDVLQGLEVAHRHVLMLRRASTATAKKEEAEEIAGKLALVTKLELFVSVVLGRQAATDFIGPMDTISNEQRVAVEQTLLANLPMQGPPVASSPRQATKPKDEPLQLRWVKSPLFANGLSDVPLSTSHPLFLHQTSLQAVLQEITEGEGVGPCLERWLGIHVLQAPVMARLGGPGITRAVRASLVAMLHQSGCLKATLRLATALTEICTSGDSARAAAFEARPPPSFLLDAWRKATGLRQWARSRVDSGVSYETSTACLLARAKFLMELQPSLEEQPLESTIEALIEGAEDGLVEASLPGAMSVDRGFSSSSTRSWSGAGGYARGLAKRQGDAQQAVLSFLKESADLDLVSLRTLQLTALERARGRERGLRLALAVLRDDARGERPVVAKAAALVHLTAAMRYRLSSLTTYTYRRQQVRY